MDPKAVDAVILGLRLGTWALNQVALAKLDSLPPEIRAAILAERDALNASWAKLAPEDRG